MGKAPPAKKPIGPESAMARTRKPNPALDAERAQRKKEIVEAEAVYGRGEKVKTRTIKDKKQRSNLKRLEKKYKTAAVLAKDSEILLENSAGFIETEHELERTYRTRQDDIKSEVAIETAKKGFHLQLDTYGPYNVSYSRTGRDLLLAGRKGHVATMDWREGKLGCELFLNETVRDATWLHNNQYFAVAQKKYVYIYDAAGVELHKLDKHVEVTNMEFLPHHFLLATIGNAGYLKYQDTSTGKVLCEHPTRMGAPTALAQNPANAIIHVGHQNGQVTLWSPNAGTPLVKILAHKGPVRSIAMDRTGHYMVTGGQDMRMAVWDVRMMKEVNNYFLRQPSSSIAVSDRGLVGVGWGTQVSIWKDLFNTTAGVKADPDSIPKTQSPYMQWGGEGHRMERLRWCPFEDILGVSHDDGFDSLIVPGAGEPNFDALEINPFETAKQRQETEVKMLLNKLQPGMISLDPNFIGAVSSKAAAASASASAGPDNIGNGPTSVVAEVADLKKRGRGRNSALRRFLRKRGNKNVIDEKRMRVEAAYESQKKSVQDKVKVQQENYGPALARFARNV